MPPEALRPGVMVAGHGPRRPTARPRRVEPKEIDSIIIGRVRLSDGEAPVTYRLRDLTVVRRSIPETQIENWWNWLVENGFPERRPPPIISGKRR